VDTVTSFNTITDKWPKCLREKKTGACCCCSRNYDL